MVYFMNVRRKRRSASATVSLFTLLMRTILSESNNIQLFVSCADVNVRSVADVYAKVFSDA